MTYVITAACVDIKDRSCVDVCPVDCIYEGDRMMYINAEECIDCGACEPVCPTEAIYFDADLPDESSPILEQAASLIVALAASGGAKVRGPLGTDISGLPDRPAPGEDAPSMQASPRSKGE